MLAMWQYVNVLITLRAFPFNPEASGEGVAEGWGS
jgi:hypothetical protein